MPRAVGLASDRVTDRPTHRGSHRPGRTASVFERDSIALVQRPTNEIVLMVTAVELPGYYKVEGTALCCSNTFKLAPLPSSCLLECAATGQLISSCTSPSRAIDLHTVERS